MIYIALGCKVSSINFSFNSILVSNLRTCFVGYAFTQDMKFYTQVPNNLRDLSLFTLPKRMPR